MSANILNLPILKIQTNGNQPYKLISTEIGSLHNIVVESKDQTTINIDLSNINFEGIEFQPNSDLGATTLEWIKNNTNINFNTVEQRVITCTDELKTTYREQLELLISKGYSIELPEQKYKLNITTDATYSDWHNLITEPHTSFMKNLIGDDGKTYGDFYGYYDAPTGYVYINVDTEIEDWYNKFTFVNIFVGLMDMMYNSTSKVYEGYDKLHCYITMFGNNNWTDTVMSISLMTNNVDWSAYSNYQRDFGSKSNWDCTLYDQVGHVLKEETIPFGNEMYFNSLSFYNRPTIINP